MSVDRHRSLTTALPLSTALLASAAGDAWAIETCAQYNAQTRASAAALARELQIANSPLRAADMAEGRSPKLDAYLAQFAPDARIHGLQGRPEPSNLNEVKAHYQHVMGSPGDPLDDPEGALREDLHVVAGPMAAHRYRASLQVPAFPPDFAYYDAALPLKLRGQTVFDVGGPEGTIRERWSNHDNRFRTGQLWRYMLRHPRDVDPFRFRTDLSAGSDMPCGLIDRDGQRLNAVFNGELALQPGDFSLVDGAFHYGPARVPEGPSRPVREAEGLRFVQRWFTGGRLPLGGRAGPEWLAEHATLHGADCDRPAAQRAPSRIGGAGSGRRAAVALQRSLAERLGTGFRSTLLQPVSADAP